METAPGPGRAAPTINGERSEPPGSSGRALQPFRLLYPVGSRKWNCRAVPNKRGDLLGAYHDGQTILAVPVMHAGASWLAVTLPDGRIGWCKQYDEAHMVQHHNTKTGFGWYRVLYCSLTDQNTYGMGLETLTPELLSDLAAAPPGPPPSLGVPRSEGAAPACTHTQPHPHSHAHASSTSTAAAAAVAAAGGGGGSGHTAAGVGTAGGVGAGGCQQQLACGRDRCSSCWLPLRLGCMAYVGSCGHSFHFECLKGLGDANICTTCGVWYAVGQSPPDSCPAPSPTSIFQHVHQTLWFVPPFYRYILIYAVMLLASPFIILASWMGLLQ